MIVEITIKALLLIIAIMFLVMAAKDKNCSGCGDREGGYCWFIILLTLLAVLIGCFALLGFLALSVMKPESLKVKN